MDGKRRSESIRKRKFKTKKRLLKTVQYDNARVSGNMSVSKTASDKREEIHEELENNSIETHEERLSEDEKEEENRDTENDEDSDRRENSDPDINEEVSEITKLLK